MKILAVDNERLALESLCRAIKSTVPEAELVSSGNSTEAYELAKDIVPDIAFLDIEMPGLNGIDLAKKIKSDVNPMINIIFTTGYSEYIETAFMELRSSGYILKPVTVDKISLEIKNLRNPISPVGSKRCIVRAFGTFEVYIDEKPVNFHYSKTKELFAYLIDNGGMCTNSELQENLWEDEGSITDHRSYLQNLISDLNKTLARHSCRDIILKRYGAIGIDRTKIYCDYYEYLTGNPAVINAFRGEYMTQYSWAEDTLASLSRPLR
ncbi:MAG: response regulator [Lachnospiraceae bacterium]|nr:response regulator [Lachnospiraceae bacterium]